MNVIFLTADALRSDRCSVNGYHRPTTPNLERLAARGMNCSQAVSPGAFTHICFPSIMTSSRPLDYGGYDSGVVGRPPSLFETARDAGHHVTAYCTTHWVCRYHGYGNGIDDEQLLFVLNTLPGTALALFRSTLAMWHRGEVSDAEVVATAKRTVGAFFGHMLDFCEERRQREKSDARAYPGERFVLDGYDYERVAGLVARHKVSFDADPLAYLRKHMPFVPKAHQWIGHEWRTMRKPGALLRIALGVLFERVGGIFERDARVFARYREKRYVDGGAVTDDIVRRIDNAEPGQPFFIWNHYQDTHVPYCAGRGRNWYRETPAYLERLGYARDIDISTAIGGKPGTEEAWHAWSALYDAAILYVDDQIGRVVDALERKGILDDTLIVVCGDHGEELGEHGDITHHFRLYSHNVRVPLLFSHPDLKTGDTDRLAVLTDVTPSIAELLGQPQADDWIGSPVWDDAVAERTEVVIESFFGGNCVFEGRPLYVAARDARWNFMWKEWRDPEDDLSPAGQQLYDHATDPLEQNNLYRPDHPEVQRLSAVIADRLRAIDHIDNKRVERAFPQTKPIRSSN